MGLNHCPLFTVCVREAFELRFSGKNWSILVTDIYCGTFPQQQTKFTIVRTPQKEKSAYRHVKELHLRLREENFQAAMIEDEVRQWFCPFQTPCVPLTMVHRCGITNWLATFGWAGSAPG